jgi:putative Mg2+ transporter-C (MgtC) family protein
VLATADWMTITIRLGAATLLGLVIGLEREWRGHDAGVRTHALVSLSSAMITVSSLLLFDDLRSHGGRVTLCGSSRAWRRQSASSLAV